MRDKKTLLSLDGTIHDPGQIITAFSPWLPRWKPGDVVTVVDRNGDKLGKAECLGVIHDLWANGRHRKSTEFRVLEP